METEEKYETSYKGLSFNTICANIHHDKSCSIIFDVAHEPHKQVTGLKLTHDNLTRDLLEDAIKKLENAEYCLTFSSGKACMVALIHMIEKGSHVLVNDDVYPETRKLLEDCKDHFSYEVSFVNMTDMNKTKNEIKSNTKLALIETPTNPNLKLVDIKSVCSMIKEKNPNAIVVVDNTISTPIYQSPLQLGADISLYSLTKYFNGHMDASGGALTMNNTEFNKRLHSLQDLLGMLPSPFDCYMTLRGIRTLSIRMREHMNSALMIAKSLESNQRIEKVIYPGLKSHPQHDLYLKQMKGFGGLITLVLRGDYSDAETFIDSLKLFSKSPNIGYSSLVHLNSHGLCESESEGIQLRLSIGLEDPNDLLADIQQALSKLREK